MTTCIITGRYYIGCHTTTNIQDGYLGSGKFLLNSIKKYGINNHQRKILETVSDKKTLYEREKDIVDKHLTDPLCMNLKRGGQGGLTLLDTNTVRRIALAGNAGLRKKLLDPAYKDKFLHKAGSKSRMRWMHDTGVAIHDGFKDKSHSDESKKRMREKAQMRTGEKNSQYGTCWITRGSENKKIKSDDFKKYEIEGWIRGRFVSREK